MLAIYPGVKVLPMTVDESRCILDADLFAEKLLRLDVKESLIDKHIFDLEDKGLLPLYNDDPNLQIISRIAGFLLADGSLGFSRDRPSSSYCFGTHYDGDLFLQDMERLGFH